MGTKHDAKPVDKRLVDHFGEELAAKLLPLVKSLEDDFYSSDAQLVAADLHEMEKVASEEFKRKHPAVAEEIVKLEERLCISR
jgi:hypothetical protein